MKQTTTRWYYLLIFISTALLALTSIQVLSILSLHFKFVTFRQWFYGYMQTSLLHSLLNFHPNLTYELKYFPLRCSAIVEFHALNNFEAKMHTCHSLFSCYFKRSSWVFIADINCLNACNLIKCCCQYGNTAPELQRAINLIIFWMQNVLL